tara:strand:+ start:393 stop:518 length:126 start_codon:yes stop_codon:yes gene_type:complete
MATEEDEEDEAVEADEEVDEVDKEELARPPTVYKQRSIRDR